MTKSKTCPFCGAPPADEWIVGPEGEKVWAGHTLVDGGGDEERYRTHHCYMNQIRALQTGDTEYGQGFNDGVEAMREIMLQAVNNEHDWLLKNPPMRHA